MVDCSHANSNKNHELQPLVMDNVANQIMEGNQSIVGLMVESHIGAGNQKIPDDLKDLQYFHYRCLHRLGHDRARGQRHA